MKSNAERHRCKTNHVADALRFRRPRTVKESTPLRACPVGTTACRAQRNVFALNGNAYFSRPPRLVTAWKSWRELSSGNRQLSVGRPTPRDSMK